MIISNENRELIRQFEKILLKGHYCKSSTLQKVYNEVFNVNMSATQCGSCIKNRIKKLVDALNKLEEEEAKQTEENNEIKEEEVENVVSGKPSRTVKKGKKAKSEAT